MSEGRLFRSTFDPVDGEFILSGLSYRVRSGGTRLPR